MTEYLDASVNVSLGTDGAPCGNTYDMFREMHLAGILHKGHKHDPNVIGAQRVLEMATIHGARALGLEKDIGSLEVGKKADFIVINPGGLHCGPYDQDQIRNGGLDPVAVVVYSCTGRDVELVVVDGETLVKDGMLVRQIEGDILKAARQSIKGIRERATAAAKLRGQETKYTNGKTWAYK